MWGCEISECWYALEVIEYRWEAPRGPFIVPRGLEVVAIFIWKPKTGILIEHFPNRGRTGPVRWHHVCVGRWRAVGDSRCRGGSVHRTIIVHGLMIFSEKILTAHCSFGWHGPGPVRHRTVRCPSDQTKLGSFESNFSNFFWLFLRGFLWLRQT
jgi:hypothetical protein